MARGFFSSEYAKNDMLMDELAEYFELDSTHINMVLDYDSLVEYFRKYMNFSNISPSIIDAIGDRVLDTINDNRKARGMTPLKTLRQKVGVPKLKRIKVKSYLKRGTKVEGYAKSTPTRWTMAEVKFIKTRIKLPLGELTARFNERYEPRTKNSIMTKRSRLKTRRSR